MRNYVKAYKEVIGSGLVREHAIIKHIEQQVMIDKYLPDSASFFYITEINTGRYRFMGKQQESVSGYTNEEFLSQGLKLFFECLHPEDVDIIVHKVYQAFTDVVFQAPPEDKKNFQLQYNYRFRRKSGEYVSLMEQIYVLEVDEAGRGSLFLGNPTILDTSVVLPIRCSAKIFRKNSVSETIFSKTFTRAKTSLDDLTRREMDILRHLSMGKSSKQIGEDLFISPHTVDTHRRNLLKKLGCKTVVELTRFAFQNGLM
jgi:DNA-binding CsgD family transcriptional regulator